VELYQRIEQLIGKKLPLYPTVEEEVLLLMERVTEAQRYAKMELREIQEKKKRPLEEEGEGQEIRMPSKKKKFGSVGKKKGKKFK